MEQSVDQTNRRWWNWPYLVSKYRKCYRSIIDTDVSRCQCSLNSFERCVSAASNLRLCVPSTLIYSPRNKHFPTICVNLQRSVTSSNVFYMQKYSSRNGSRARDHVPLF